MSQHPETTGRQVSRWTWFAFLSAIGIFTLAAHIREGQEGFALLPSGFLLLAFFAFHHPPLIDQSAAWENLSKLSRLAAIAGLAGLLMVIAAAGMALLAT